MSSFATALEKMNMNVAEFGICAAFWVGIYIVTSFISLQSVLRKLCMALCAPVILPS